MTALDLAARLAAAMSLDLAARVLAIVAVTGCGGASAAAPAPAPDPAPAPAPTTSSQPERLAGTRVAVTGVAELGVALIETHGGAPALTSEDESIRVIVLDLEEPYRAGLLARGGPIMRVPEEAREAIVAADGRAAELARWVEGDDATLLALAIGDDTGSAIVLVALAPERAALADAIERALRAARWLAPRAPDPGAMRADLDTLCRAAGEITEPIEGSWTAALVQRALPDVHDPTVREVLGFLSRVSADDRRQVVRVLAEDAGAPAFDCPALDRVLSR